MQYRALLALVISASLLSGCGGGGGSSTPGGSGGGNGNGGNPNSVTSTLSANGGTISLPASGSVSGATFTYPSNSNASAKVTFAASGTGPTPFSNVRRPAQASASAVYTMTFSGVTANETLTYTSLTLSYSGSGSNLILEIFDTTSSTVTNPVETCPETSSSGTITFTCSNVSITNLTDTFAIEIVTGSPLVAANAFTCPLSDGTTSIARSGVSGTTEATRHGLTRLRPSMKSSTGQIAVVYDRATLQRSSASFARSEQSAGATLSQTFDYPRLGTTIHVLAVAPSQSAAAIAALRAQPGVLNATATQRRYALTSTPLMADNHYFLGFSPANVAPYYESSSVPGQWDMHAIQMEYAYGYSQAGNTAPSGSSGFPNAMGTHSVKIAIIDTGQDTLHPDLAPNVVYQKCFITPTDQNGNASGTQTTSNFSTDPFGHGTDVSGIATAVTNPANIPASTNGFAAAGGNSGLMAYRIFPTPDDSCEESNPDNQCGAFDMDIASAINDAVAQGAKVISMSFGGGSCVAVSSQFPGGDDDPVEGTAVENAIQANVVVVAASGNEGASTPDAPGCDAGVIAVGATSLDDGTPNYTDPSGGNAGGTPTNPVEYVASYSNYSSASQSSWGIVAPGGDPVSDMDGDDLHWIENIWTSTPFMANSGDTTYLGECTDDYPNSSGTTAPVDCRTLIAGTSMATPHVAGVAGLICGLNPADCTPTLMKNLLCSTADQLVVSSTSTHQGCGRLNAYRAVAVALGDADPH